MYRSTSQPLSIYSRSRHSFFCYTLFTHSLHVPKLGHRSLVQTTVQIGLSSPLRISPVLNLSMLATPTLLLKHFISSTFISVYFSKSNTALAASYNTVGMNVFLHRHHPFPLWPNPILSSTHSDARFL